jgi:threonine/homoserine efflux transporter RhtA
MKLSVPAGRLFPLNVALGSVGLAAWTFVMGVGLPRHYSAQHWDAAWVGLDVAETLFLLLTAWGVWKKRLITVVFAVVTSTLFACDAWFDCVTARDGELRGALIFAVVLEAPAAIVLTRAALRILRHGAAHGSVWRATLDAD